MNATEMPINGTAKKRNSVRYNDRTSDDMGKHLVVSAEFLSNQRPQTSSLHALRICLKRSWKRYILCESMIYRIICLI